MKYLGAFLASVFGGIFNYLALVVTKKTAFTISVTGLFLALTTAFYVSLKLMIVGTASYIPNNILLMYFYVLLPSNIETCLSAIFGAYLLRYFYRYKMMLVSEISNIFSK